jgi:hypothetical protein
LPAYTGSRYTRVEGFDATGVVTFLRNAMLTLAHRFDKLSRMDCVQLKRSDDGQQRRDCDSRAHVLRDHLSDHPASSKSPTHRSLIDGFPTTTVGLTNTTLREVPINK